MASRIRSVGPTSIEQPARKRSRVPRYEDWSKNALFEKARELGIEGRTEMSKRQLVQVLRGRAEAALSA